MEMFFDVISQNNFKVKWGIVGTLARYNGKLKRINTLVRVSVGMT